MLDNLNTIMKVHTQKYLTDGDKEMSTMLITFQDNNPVGVYLLAGFNPQTDVSIIENIVKESQATSYVFSSEAWMRNVAGNEYDGTLPSQSPDRIECLVVSACSVSEECTKVFRINRIGKIAKLTEEFNGDVMMMWNRFNIYKSIETTH